MNFIPDHFITDMSDFHSFYTHYEPNHLHLVQQSLQSYVEVLCFSLNKSVKIYSNPYSVAKLVETLFTFIQKDEKVMKEIINTNETAVHNITEGLVHFYIDIEFTGSSN